MTTGPQRLFEPPSGAAKMTEWPDVSKGMTPNQPVAPGFFTGPGAYLRNPHEKRLAMFHTAREIREGWAPAEGDRKYVGTDLMVHGDVRPPGTDDPRAGESTLRPETTDARHNERTMSRTGERGYRRTLERKSPPKETDEQMWDRKQAEASETGLQRAADSANVLMKSGILARKEVGPLVAFGHMLAKYPNPDVSLVEHLQSGADMPPIPLSHHRRTEGGKPEIAGGQHRVGAWNQINPEQLLPVTHYETIVEAKADKDYT